MKLKEDNIDIYNNSAIILNRKTPSFLCSWVMILIVLSVIFVIMLFIPFNIYSTYNGSVFVYGNDTYISLNVDKNDFPINKNKKLYIKDTIYKYEVITIKESNVILDINLKRNINIDNNIIVVNILKSRTTIFEIIKKRVRKGFGL